MRLNTKFGEKLRSQAGETLTETLVALLISVLSLVMLASAVSSSTRIVTSSRKSMEDYYVKTNGLSTKGSPDGNGSVSIAVEGSPSPLESSVPVNLYEGPTVQGREVVSYELK